MEMFTSLRLPVAVRDRRPSRSSGNQFTGPFRAMNEIEKEDDIEEDVDGYFLEPMGGSVNISEKIAEANRRLFEQADVDDSNEERTKKVQFSEQLLHFESPQTDYCSDDSESISSNSGSEISPIPCGIDNELILSNPSETFEESHPIQTNEQHHDPDDDVVITETTTDNKNEDIEEINCEEDETPTTSKLLLVLLPREQSSSCESVIGEENDELNYNEMEKVAQEVKEKTESKPRPKSANKGAKRSVKKQNCKLSTVSPDLDCNNAGENNRGHLKVRPKGSQKACEDLEHPKRAEPSQCEVKTVTVENCAKNNLDVMPQARCMPVIRPKTAPTKRSCCIPPKDLPLYNGHNSEYGLSAEQLIERKRKIREFRNQRKMENIRRRQANFEKRQENDLKFTEWLESKTPNTRSSSVGSNGQSKVDTLLRSDVFIQRNAVYAKKCGVVYAVDYSVGKSKSAISDVRRKVFSIRRLLENVNMRDEKTYEVNLNGN